MDSFYGISNSDMHKRSSLSPIHSYASQNPYYHHTLPVVDPYASPDGHTTVLKNLNSPYLRYLHSAISLTASPKSAGDHSPSFGYNHHRTSESSSRMEPLMVSPKSAGNHSPSFGYNYRRTSESSSRMEPPRLSRSPVVFSNRPAKVVEDVLVMDGVLVKKPTVDKSRSSSSSSSIDSGGSSSSVGRNYKMDLCLSYLENSGFCRYGSKCQFAHGNKELRSSPVSYKSMFEIPCQSYSISGTCSYGSRCRFLHYETSTSTSTKVATSTIKQDEVTSGIVKQKISNWYPLDDDIQIQTTAAEFAPDEDFDAHINSLLYGLKENKRLPVFSQICPE